MMMMMMLQTGLSPLHVASYYGQIEFVRTMLTALPATARSEPPGVVNPLVGKELGIEYGLTPLHMAAQSGHENLVRLLLNFQGVQVDASSATMVCCPLPFLPCLPPPNWDWAAERDPTPLGGSLRSRSRGRPPAKPLHRPAQHQGLQGSASQPVSHHPPVRPGI